MNQLKEEFERLVEKNRRQAGIITTLQKCLEEKNLELDAMHYVWCDGGCSYGVHRYSEMHGKPITEDIIERAVRGIRRLIGWHVSKKYRDWYQKDVKDDPNRSLREYSLGFRVRIQELEEENAALRMKLLAGKVSSLPEIEENLSDDFVEPDF